MSGVLLAWIVQLTALTQSLVVDWQNHRLHVHELVVRDGRLVEEELQQKDQERDLIGLLQSLLKTRLHGCHSASLRDL